MLVTGLPYDPTYYGKNTFLIFPLYANQYNTEGTVDPGQHMWFDNIYLVANEYDTVGNVTEVTDTWFAGIYLVANQYDTVGTAEAQGTLIYQDAPSKIVVKDIVTDKLMDDKIIDVKGGRLGRTVTFGTKPSFIEVEDLTLSFDVFNTLPVAPYADTEDEQGQTFEIDFNNVTGLLVAPFAKSEFVPRTRP